MIVYFYIYIYTCRFLPLALVIEQDEQDIVPLIWDRAS